MDIRLCTVYSISSCLYFWLSFNSVIITTVSIQTSFVGWGNYTMAFLSDTKFTTLLIKYLLELFLMVPMVLVFSVILAMLLTMKTRIKRISRVVFFLPVIIMSGPVVNELRDCGADKIQGLKQFAVYIFISKLPEFLSVPLTYLFDSIVMILWLSGVQILIFLIGIQKIDISIYEAAQVDGASSWERFWKITLPTLKPLILINAIYTIVDISSFSLNPIIIFIKENMFNIKSGFGYASALSWVYFVILSFIIALTYLIIGRGEKIQRSKKGRGKKL